MKKKDKSGQIYLITAMIIITILVAFIIISNYSKKTSSSGFFYVGEEINIESEKVMDYALMNPANETDIIGNFTKNVSDYIGKNTKIYFIIDEKCYNYENEDKKILNIYSNEKNISCEIDNLNYTFSKPQGKYFYFVMIKQDENEKYVYQNE